MSLRTFVKGVLSVSLSLVVLLALVFRYYKIKTKSTPQQGHIDFFYVSYASGYMFLVLTCIYVMYDENSPYVMESGIFMYCFCIFSTLERSRKHFLHKKKSNLDFVHKNVSNFWILWLRHRRSTIKGWKSNGVHFGNHDLSLGFSFKVFFMIGFACMSFYWSWFFYFGISTRMFEF